MRLKLNYMSAVAFSSFSKTFHVIEADVSHRTSSILNSLVFGFVSMMLWWWCCACWPEASSRVVPTHKITDVCGWFIVESIGGDLYQNVGGWFYSMKYIYIYTYVCRCRCMCRCVCVCACMYILIWWPCIMQTWN